MSKHDQSRYLELAADLIAKSDGVIIAAGAGLGVDSGLPDYRTSRGLYTNACEMPSLVGGFSEMCSARYFQEDPEGFWRFQWWLYNRFQNAQPHRGYENLLHFANSRPHGYIIYTSNIDSYFSRAGFSSDRIHECHGSLKWLQCARNCHSELYLTEVAFAKMKSTGTLVPTCPNCGEPQRPNVMMFDDLHWLDEVYKAQFQSINAWLTNNRAVGSRLVCIELGAGLAVPRVRIFSQQLGVPIVRINPDQPKVKRRAIGPLIPLKGGALQITDSLMSLLQDKFSISVPLCNP